MKKIQIRKNSYANKQDRAELLIEGLNEKGRWNIDFLNLDYLLDDCQRTLDKMSYGEKIKAVVEQAIWKNINY